jgi:uncharacterized protein DUF6714
MGTTEKEIETAIEDAFSDVEYPGDDQITAPPSDWQKEFWAQTFRGVHARNLPPVVIEKEQYRLHFFTPAARRFYLPAFLRAALHQGYGYVLHMLDPPPDMTLFEREYGAYTTAQKQAIRLVLEHLRSESEDSHVRDALERFWTHFEPTPPRPLEMPPGRKDEVAHAVLQAFADVPYPGDDAIGEPTADPDIGRDFRGYTPLTVPRNVFLYYSQQLHLFSPEGRRYFLPTYVRGALEEDLRDMTTQTLVWRLGDAKDPKYAAEWYDFYTTAQKQAVRLFLEYVYDVCLSDPHPDEILAFDALIALDFYWLRGESGPKTPPPPVDPGRKAAVRRAIREAFADVPYSSDHELWGKLGLRVEEVTPDLVVEHQEDLPIKAEVPYYMPAFLLAALEEVGEVVYKVVERLQVWDACKCTPAQRRAVVQFLEYVRDAMPHRSLGPAAQRALNLVWAYKA